MPDLPQTPETQRALVATPSQPSCDEEEADVVMLPSQRRGTCTLLRQMPLPLSVKLVATFATVLVGAGLIDYRLGWTRARSSASMANGMDMAEAEKTEVRSVLETGVKSAPSIPGYTAFGHVNCFDHRGAISEGLPVVRMAVKTMSQCAVRCNMYPQCSGFVIFHRYAPYQCWLRSSIAKDKGFCQHEPYDDSQDGYYFATYEKLHGVETPAFEGALSFQGKCLGVTEPKDGSVVKLKECGCSACWTKWEAALPLDPWPYWQTFRLSDFPSASVTSFRLKGTDKCLDVHDHADWRKDAGLDTPMNYLQLWTCAADDRSREDQKWIVVQSTDRVSFQLQWLTDPGLAVDVPAGKNTVGNHVQIYKFVTGWPNQVLQTM
ncbi:unnamed protein product [Symbiodinium natans]|uniref:Uncharacterized protein n=1 Tax=Symbiodinium natans TaxID=878477 RepID=A0A812LR93_9DINO|nr:unnamed protein product [Symbiodinium natans]